MQKSTTNLLASDSSSQKVKTSLPILKILKTIVVCASIVLTGLYVEIVGATLPDLKLQHKLYHRYDTIGVLFALSSGLSILGALFTVFVYNSFNGGKRMSGIFGKTAKLDFLLSVSFFIATTGMLIVQFVNPSNSIMLFTSFICLGLAQGMAIIGASYSISELWQSSTIQLFTTKYRFTIVFLYAAGALLAPLLVRFFLKPFLYSYRQYYDEPNREFLQSFQITSKLATTSTITTTRTTSYKPLNPRLTFKPTRSTTTQTKQVTEPNALSIDFLRLDANSEGSDSLYRIFDKYFSFIFYVLTALNALMVIFYSVLFLIESKVFIIKSHITQSIEMATASKQQPAKSTPTIVIEKKSIMNSIKSELTNFSIFISDNAKTAGFKFTKSNAVNAILGLLILLLLTIFYSVVYASLKIQSNYLLSYSIQPEYVPRYYDEYFNEIFDYPAKPLANATSSFSNLLSFTASYNLFSLSLVKGSYLQITFYSGILIGLALNFLLVSFTPLKSISLLYINIIFHNIIQIIILLLTATSLDKQISLSKPSFELIWFFIQFSNGFFLSPLPALLYDQLTTKPKTAAITTTPNPSSYTFKSIYLTVCELLGLSVGSAAFQWLVSYLIEQNKNFNSFINIQFVNSISTLILFILIHTCYLVVNKKKSTITPH